MRFLRALLNSGVFMIVLLAAVTLYLVYSDNIRQDHGDVSVAESSRTQTSVSDVSQPESATVSTPAAAVNETAFPPLDNRQTALVPAPMPMMQTPQDMSAMPPMAEMPPMPMMQAPQGMPAMPPMAEMPPMPMMQAPQDMSAMPPMAEMPPMPMMQVPQGMPAMPPMAEMPMMQPQQAATPVELARATFFAGDLVTAEKQYRDILASNNDPDLHGELGNVYFAQQQWDKASMEYMLAVDGLMGQGRSLQAQYVIGILMQINPEKGQQAINELRSRTSAPR